MEAVKILLCVVALFLLGNSYAEPTSCGAYYNQGGAPAVIENPLCSNWVLSRDFFGNHTVNCHLAAGTIKGPDEDSKDQFFCDLDLQIPFRGIIRLSTNCTWFSYGRLEDLFYLLLLLLYISLDLACYELKSRFFVLENKRI